MGRRADQPQREIGTGGQPGCELERRPVVLAATEGHIHAASRLEVDPRSDDNADVCRRPRQDRRQLIRKPMAIEQTSCRVEQHELDVVDVDEARNVSGHLPRGERCSSCGDGKRFASGVQLIGCAHELAVVVDQAGQNQLAGMRLRERLRERKERI
jgi:hypothetical protein